MILTTVGIVSLIAGLYFIFLVSSSSHPGRVTGEKLLAASQEYARELRAQGNLVPDSVSIGVLIQKGLLRHEDVRGFDGLDVSVALADETTPRKMLVRVRMPDGHELAVLGDGSVQSLQK